MEQSLKKPLANQPLSPNHVVPKAFVACGKLKVTTETIKNQLNSLLDKLNLTQRTSTEKDVPIFSGIDEAFTSVSTLLQNMTDLQQNQEKTTHIQPREKNC